MRYKKIDGIQYNADIIDELASNNYKVNLNVAKSLLSLKKTKVNRRTIDYINDNYMYTIKAKEYIDKYDHYSNFYQLPTDMDLDKNDYNPNYQPNNDDEVKNIEILNKINQDNHQEKNSNIIFIILFIFGLYILYQVYNNLPPLSLDELTLLKQHGWSGYLPGPKNLNDVKIIKEILLKYTHDYLISVIIAFCSLYIFMQIFAIPGTIFLSVLAGPLFHHNIILSIMLISFSATTGSCCSYILSKLYGKPLIYKYFDNNKLNFFKSQVQLQIQQKNLFWYLLFLRLTPILPNILINLASPIVGIPLIYFFSATLIGLMPANFLHVHTGLALSEITDDGLNSRLMYQAMKLLAIGSLALIPTIFQNYFAKKLKMNE